VESDGVAGQFEKGAGFLLFDFQLTEHGAGLFVGFFGLMIPSLFEGEFDES